jgi:hypothetical protein
MFCSMLARAFRSPRTGLLASGSAADMIRALDLPKSVAHKILEDAFHHAADHERADLAACLLRLDAAGSIDSLLHRDDTVDNWCERALRGNEVFLVAVSGSSIRLKPEQQLRLVERCRNAAPLWVLPLAAALLEHGAPVVLQPAATLLLQAALRLVGPNGLRRRSALADRIIDESLTVSLTAYPIHRQTAALIAVALGTPRPGPRLAALLSEPDHPDVRRLRTVLNQLDAPPVRRAMLGWLGASALGSTVARRLTEVRRAELLGDIFTEWHWLLTPRRRAALREAGQGLRSVPELVSVINLPCVAQRGFPALLQALPLPAPARIERLSSCIALGDDLARLMGLRLLGQRDRDHGAPATFQFCFDSNVEVATLAAAMWLSSSGAPQVGLERLQQSNHAAVRSKSLLRLAHRDVHLFLDSLESFSTAQQVAIALGHLSHDKPAFREALAARLRGEAGASLLALLQLIRRLRLVSEFDAMLTPLAGSSDSRLVATAMALLGECRSTGARAALRAGLNHSDARVRANAIESIARHADPDLGAALRPWLEADSPRSRANAIVGLKDVDHAAVQASLNTMLRSVNPAMRLSAAWAAGRLGRAMPLPLLDSIAATDPDPRVRQRGRLASRLLQSHASQLDRAPWAA